MKIKYYENDLPENTDLGDIIAIDTETMGLNPLRDRLCLIQISTGNNICHLIQYKKNKKINSPNLIKILTNKKILKIFHFARFDVAVLKNAFNVDINNIYCTKIASKLARTFTDKHGYKDLCKELLNIQISKNEQTSDWGNPKLTTDQQKYAATDVIYLHKIKEKIDKMLIREKRTSLAKACFDFITYKTELDLLGCDQIDIFSH